MNCHFCNATCEKEVCDICRKFLLKPETGLPIMRAHIMAKCPSSWSPKFKKDFVDRVMEIVASMKPRN